MTTIDYVRTIKTRTWCAVIVCLVMMVLQVTALNGDNVCMVKQKYNITKRVKYRAPMSVRTYVWCFSMPPRCSKWNTEMRDLTRLETEERVAEVAVCCPGYKMRDVSCVPICPHGKTGPGCSEDCPDNKWGPNCINECKRCKNGFCSPITGECECLDGWKGESCDTSMPPTTATPSLEEILTTLTTKTTTNSTPRAPTTVTPRTTITTPRTIITSPKTTVTPRVTSTTTVSTPAVTVALTTEALTVATTSPSTKETVSKTMLQTSKIVDMENQKKAIKTEMFLTSTETPKVELIDNTTFVATSTSKAYNPTTEEITQKTFAKPILFKTEKTKPTSATEPAIIGTIPAVESQLKPVEIFNTTEILKSTIPSTLATETSLKEETSKKETTIKIHPTTVKFKPKEIWIRPAQKGESPTVETKIKSTHDFSRHKITNNRELTPAITTPKTIIVSIIPTSVSYSTFKKIALTSSYISTKHITTFQSYNKTEHEFTEPMLSETTTSPIKLSPLSRKELLSTSYFINASLVPSTFITQKTSTKSTSLVTKPLEVTKTISHIDRTNSMTTDINKNVSKPITITSSNVMNTPKQDVLLTSPVTKSSVSLATVTTEQTTKHFLKYATSKKVDAAVTKIYKTTNPPKIEDIKANVTKSFTKVTTDEPSESDDEEFHILTEPEHITAVMGGKNTERSSIDLISVISIAGGVMMAVITVAVIIVMVERCKKPRYEDVRKINDIRMQVMIDNNDNPPPYVRSIFHTPLPDPPTSEKCHYQPISTLDRNLKQFMRPVVVQTISPIMLENFRGILECHYDHLPRRSHDFGTMQTRSSIAPSLSDCSELRQLRASVTESAIEALKCEAKLDVLDNTTSEPLYAEIPCWRPPSEHAIEIMNMNGEAVTEL